MLDELITKRFKIHDRSHFELKEEIKAQGEIIQRQSRDIEELVIQNSELHDEYENLKDQIEDLKEAIQTHGESLKEIGA